MTNEASGSLIGSVFGLLFMEINAGALPASLGLTVRLLGVVVFLGFVAFLVRARSAPDDMPVDIQQQHPGFGRGYWVIVAAEVMVVGAAGLVVINGPLDASDASVAWIALVVGFHFFGLAVVWRQPFLRWLGAAITVCGAVGVLLAAVGSSAASIAALAGVVPGALLLGAGWWSVLGHARRRPHRATRT